MYKGAQIVSQTPAWLLVENILYDFEKNVDGKKLLPFMSKRYIQIPKKSEEGLPKQICFAISRKV